MVFWANNSSGIVDLDATQRWRQYTNDFYTGTAYAHIAEVHPSETIILPSSNFTHLADMAFANDTVEWLMTFNNPPVTGRLPLPVSWSNMSFYVDSGSELERSNDSHNVNIVAGPIQEVFIQQPEFYFDWATLASTTLRILSFDTRARAYLAALRTSPPASVSARGRCLPSHSVRHARSHSPCCGPTHRAWHSPTLRR